MKTLLNYILIKLFDKRTLYQAAKTNDLSNVIWQFYFNSQKKCLWKLESNPELDPFDVIFNEFSELLLENNIDVEELG